LGVENARILPSRDVPEFTDRLTSPNRRIDWAHLSRKSPLAFRVRQSTATLNIRYLFANVKRLCWGTLGAQTLPKFCQAEQARTTFDPEVAKGNGSADAPEASRERPAGGTHSRVSGD